MFKLNNVNFNFKMKASKHSVLNFELSDLLCKYESELATNFLLFETDISAYECSNLAFPRIELIDTKVLQEGVFFKNLSVKPQLSI